MKGSSIVPGVLAFAGSLTRLAHGEVVTAQEKISALDADDFVLSIGGPEPTEPFEEDGVEARAANLAGFPVLEDLGLSMAIVNIDACSINLPHVHPRATEMTYMLEGSLTAGFVEENGGDGAVINTISAGDVTFYPVGLIHYQQNMECEPAAFVAAFDSEDPGTVTITSRFFELPSEALEAALNFDIDEIEALIDALPEAPIESREECLCRCGLLDDHNDRHLKRQLRD